MNHTLRKEFEGDESGMVMILHKSNLRDQALFSSGWYTVHLIQKRIIKIIVNWSFPCWRQATMFVLFMLVDCRVPNFLPKSPDASHSVSQLSETISTFISIFIIFIILGYILCDLKFISLIVLLFHAHDF